MTKARIVETYEGIQDPFSVRRKIFHQRTSEKHVSVSRSRETRSEVLLEKGVYCVELLTASAGKAARPREKACRGPDSRNEPGLRAF